MYETAKIKQYDYFRYIFTKSNTLQVEFHEGVKTKARSGKL